MATIKICYLSEYTKKIEQLTNDILSQRDRYGDCNVLVDEEDAQKLVDALEGLRIAIETTQLA